MSPTRNDYLNDPKLLQYHLEFAHESGREIDREAARAVASHWHNGQASPLYSFASANHADRSALLRELSDIIDACYAAAGPRERLELDMLATFFIRLPTSD